MVSVELHFQHMQLDAGCDDIMVSRSSLFAQSLFPTQFLITTTHISFTAVRHVQLAFSQS